MAGARRPFLGILGVVVIAALAGLTGGCVTYTVEEDPAADEALALAAQPVAIPLTGAGGATDDPQVRALNAYYADVVAQLQATLADRELDRLRILLATHDRPNAPEWARQQIARFRVLGEGLQFELHAAQSTVLRAVADPLPPVGAPLEVELVLDGSPVPGIVVPGTDDFAEPARLLVTWRVVDENAFGDRFTRKFDQVVALPDSVDFDRGESFRFRHEVPGLTPEGARRQVDVFIDLAPGRLRLDGDPLPNTRVRLGHRTFEMWPEGVEVVRRNPYTNLREAIVKGEPEVYDHILVAAHLMDEEFVEDAIARSIEGVRNGVPSLARVCGHALQVLTGAEITADDRAGWLRWWQARGTGR